MARRVEPIVPDTFLRPDKATVYQNLFREVAETVCLLSEDQWKRVVEYSGASNALRPEIEALVAMYRVLNCDGNPKKPDARRMLKAFEGTTRNMVRSLLDVMGNSQAFDAVFTDSDLDSARLKTLFIDLFNLATLAQTAAQRLRPLKYKTRPVALDLLVAGVASTWESISGKKFSSSRNVAVPHKYNAMAFLTVVASIADPSLDETKIRGAARAFIAARRSGHI